MAFDLNNYICTIPFKRLEIHPGAYALCCPEWLKKELPKGFDKLDTIWNSEEANDIRKSIEDGSYKYCSKLTCPHLSELINLKNKVVSPIKHKRELDDDFWDLYDSETGKMKMGPKNIHMSFDLTCNYKCPSCRNNMFVESSKGIERINTTITKMEELFAKDLELIYTIGSGDPFASVSFRNYLRTFDTTKYPKLKTIMLHTNASLWNKKMWDSMPNVHKYVKVCEISIDAATKETYENKTRLGGNWENLLNNLNFISKLPNLETIRASFVVQKENYKEMELFYKTMREIFPKNGKVYFGRLTKWKHISNEIFNYNDVTNKNHPEHNLFLKELKKVAHNPYVLHNMHELVEKNNNLI